jgi:putative transposase
MYMSDNFSTRTVCCKLRVDASSHADLLQTQRAFNAAATYCAQVAWEKGITNKNTLHHEVYGATRAQFGLGAQLACCARDKAAEAVRAARQHANATCPTFDASSSIRYDARTYRLMERDQVSLNTIYGRVRGQLDLGDFQRCYLYDLSWKIGGAELVRRGNVWYLCITQSKKAPDPDEPTGVLGVDLGIVNLATDSDGETFSGEHVGKVRERYHQHRRRLQKRGTKNAKRRLKKLSKKEHRFQKDTNHRIAKRLIAKAAETRKALALEDLTHIRTRTQGTVRRKQRRRHSSWAFSQLRQYITYKARQAGTKVFLVDPRNTSKTCSCCSYCNTHNRRSQASFVCLCCGYAASADFNAARNIASAGVAPRGYPLPIAAEPLVLAVSCLL